MEIPLNVRVILLVKSNRLNPSSLTFLKVKKETRRDK